MILVHNVISSSRSKDHQTQKLVDWLENIRDELIEQGNDAVEALLAEFEQMERQKLKQLVRHAAKEKKAEKLGKHYKNLFTYLKEHS